MFKSLLRFAIPAVAALSLVSCGGNTSTKNSETKDTETATEQSTVTTPQAGVVNTIADGTMIQPADLPILIDFSAVWCGPCKKFAPIFHAAAEEYKGKFYFYTVDIDKCPEMAKTYSATSIPQVSVLYPDGKILNNEPGFMDKEQFDAFLAGI